MPMLWVAGTRPLTTTNPIVLPETKPRAVREHVVVPSIRGHEVRRTQRSRVRRCENALQALDFSNDLIGIHWPQMI